MALITSVCVPVPAHRQKASFDDAARLLVVRGSTGDGAAAAGGSPAASPVKEAADGDGPGSEATAGAVLAFVHFRYEIVEECLLLKV